MNIDTWISKNPKKEMLSLMLEASKAEKSQYTAIWWKYSKNPSKQFDKSWLTIPGCYLQKSDQFLLKLRYFCVTWYYFNFITFECSYGVFEARKWPDFICYAQFWHLILNWYSIHMTCPNVVETFDWSMSYGCLFVYTMVLNCTIASSNHKTCQEFERDCYG